MKPHTGTQQFSELTTGTNADYIQITNTKAACSDFNYKQGTPSASSDNPGGTTDQLSSSIIVHVTNPQTWPPARDPCRRSTCGRGPCGGRRGGYHPGASVGLRIASRCLGPPRGRNRPIWIPWCAGGGVRRTVLLCSPPARPHCSAHNGRDYACRSTESTRRPAGILRPPPQSRTESTSPRITPAAPTRRDPPIRGGREMTV